MRATRLAGQSRIWVRESERIRGFGCTIAFCWTFVENDWTLLKLHWRILFIPTKFLRIPNKSHLETAELF